MHEQIKLRITTVNVECAQKEKQKICNNREKNKTGCVNRFRNL